MSKLTKRQRKFLEQVESNLQMAIAYINRDNTLICYRHMSKGGGTDLEYVRRNDGTVIAEVNKHHGSGIVGLAVGLQKVQQFLAADAAGVDPFCFDPLAPAA